MTQLQEFLENCNNKKINAFQIQQPENKQILCFKKRPVGNAIFLDWAQTDFSSDWRIQCNIYEITDYRVAAILKDNEMYLTSVFIHALHRYFPDEFSSPNIFRSLPDHVKSLHICTEKINSKIRDVIFPEFLKTLPSNETTLTQEDTDLLRSVILGNEPLPDPELPVFDENDMAQQICGYRNLLEDTAKQLEENREYWIIYKAKQILYEPILSDPSLFAEDWEIRLAETIQKLQDAGVRKAAVNFIVNGKHISGKIWLDFLMEKLIQLSSPKEEKDYFLPLNFSGHSDDLWKTCRSLSCEDIKRIWYERIPIYENN